MTQQWTTGQVHDTVAAIARQAAYNAGNRQSILGRILRRILHWIDELFDRVSDTLNARLVVVAAILLLATIVIARIVVDRRLAAQKKRGLGLRIGMAERRDYWALARELSAAGEYTDACHALYGAVLESFASSGLVRYHASKTSGDYARELRRRGSPLATDFRAFGRSLEHAAYGRDAVSRAEFDALFAGAERIVRAIRAGAAA